MKLWFIEPRPNVFVSGVKDSVGNYIVDYLHQYCPPESGLLIFRRINDAPGYEIRGIGDTQRRITEISGLQLILEKTLEAGGEKPGKDHPPSQPAPQTPSAPTESPAGKPPDPQPNAAPPPAPDDGLGKTLHLEA
jgi:CRISPR-associated protein Cas2